MISKKHFKIVHLSDLHLTASDNAARSEPRLFGSLRGMNVAFRKIVKSKPLQDANLILVTGDITDRGDKRAWKIFWNSMRDSGLEKKALVLPGNHDMCCLGLRLPSFSKTGYRKADLEKAIKGLNMGHQPIKFPWVKMPDPRVAIFGLNSNNIGNFSGVNNALGEISFYQLEHFARLLYQYRDVPVKIVALHHSPNIPEPSTMKKRYGKDYHTGNRLFGFIPQDLRRTLRLMCLSQRARLVAHGHVHLSEDRRVNGIRIVGAPPTTQPVESIKGKSKYQFYSYTIHGQGGRVTTKLKTVKA
jgi:3',5'-cyclic AMP phosphodiesterase CpdA